jgi:nascent polypeptide-associated complex subunit alpha
MMQRMGMKVDEIPGVTQVLIRSSTRSIVIDGPSVSSVVMQGQRMFQIIGGKITEQPAGVVGAQVSVPAPTAQATAPQAPAAIPQADIDLVASQTGRSQEEARKALESSDGDLAKAILLLQSQKPA